MIDQPPALREVFCTQNYSTFAWVMNNAICIRSFRGTPHREPPKLAFARFGEPLIAERRRHPERSEAESNGSGDAEPNREAEPKAGSRREVELLFFKVAPRFCSHCSQNFDYGLGPPLRMTKN